MELKIIRTDLGKRKKERKMREWNTVVLKVKEERTNQQGPQFVLKGDTERMRALCVVRRGPKKPFMPGTFSFHSQPNVARNAR